MAIENSAQQIYRLQTRGLPFPNQNLLAAKLCSSLNWQESPPSFDIYKVKNFLTGVYSIISFIIHAYKINLTCFTINCENEQVEDNLIKKNEPKIDQKFQQSQIVSLRFKTGLNDRIRHSQQFINFLKDIALRKLLSALKKGSEIRPIGNQTVDVVCFRKRICYLKIIQKQKPPDNEWYRKNIVNEFNELGIQIPINFEMQYSYYYQFPVLNTDTVVANSLKSQIPLESKSRNISNLGGILSQQILSKVFGSQSQNLNKRRQMPMKQSQTIMKSINLKLKEGNSIENFQIIKSHMPSVLEVQMKLMSNQQMHSSPSLYYLSKQDYYILSVRWQFQLSQSESRMYAQNIHHSEEEKKSYKKWIQQGRFSEFEFIQSNRSHEGEEPDPQNPRLQ